MSGLPLTGGNPADRVRETVDAIYRSDSRRVLATLIRLLGDFELAEEALDLPVLVSEQHYGISGHVDPPVQGDVG